MVLFEDVWGNTKALRRALDVPVLELPKPPPKEEPLKAGTKVSAALGAFFFGRFLGRKTSVSTHTALFFGGIWRFESIFQDWLELEEVRDTMEEVLGIFQVQETHDLHLQVDRKHLWHPYTSA